MRSQAKSTNKVIELLLTKLVNEIKTNLDEHLHTILYVYKITFTMATWHTPFQLAYWLHPLMQPTKYLLLTTNSQTPKDSSSIQALVNKLSQLAKLEESKHEATKITRKKHWNHVF